MGISESIGTALFIVALVFLVLVSLWITLRVMSALIRKIESFIAAAKVGASQQTTQNK